MRKSARMLIPAGIAILIGTAFIASTFLFSNAMTASLTRQTTAQFGDADYMIAPKPFGELDDKALEYAYTRSVGDFHIDRMRATEGVDGVRVDASATVTVTNGDRNVNVQAIAASDGAKLLPVKVTHGDQPADNHEIALPQSAANQLGVKVGDTVTIDSQAAHAMRQAAALSAGTRADSAATADASTPTPTDVP
ncbi:ABC transporter permease, partial [Bifidobacterium callitrichos]